MCRGVYLDSRASDHNREDSECKGLHAILLSDRMPE